MKGFTKKLVSSPLFSGSLIMIVGTNLANIIAYFYHFVMGRMMGPISYGKLAAIFSIITLATSSFSFLSLVIVKFVSSSEKKEVPSIYKWFYRKILLVGFLVGLIVVISAPVISAFLHIEIYPIIFLGPVLILSIFLLFYKSILQGLLKFKEVVLSSNLDMAGRLVIGVIFVHFGFSVLGAVWGMAISSFLIFLVLKKIVKRNIDTKSSKKFNKSVDIYKYSLPVFIMTLATNSFFTSDVILVKHFFSNYDAGIYASLSTLGKIIYFATTPVSAVMFPLIVKRYAKGYQYKKILILSIILVTWIAASIVGVYMFIPEIMIRILFGVEYLQASIYLGLFGVFMMIFSINLLLVNYFMSIEKTKVSLFVFVGSIFQIVGILLFHKTISNVINVSIAVNSLLFVVLLIYFVHDAKKSKQATR